ncbi:MAG TPA: hypothetical protein DGZ24_02435 [Rhodospirillaceae bacterium]|nr:hypothetical protein [Candidatus Neomarinimicrobiota bacterium]HCX14159.1 hypothetical protein [Rhodospirillaceae bacterium]
MKISTLMWLVLIITVGVSMFLLKYKVQALEEELVFKQVQIAKDRDAVRVLEAEWAYLNDPERLQRLSAEYLGFVSPKSDQIKTISALPFREGMVPLPKISREDTASKERSSQHGHIQEITTAPQSLGGSATTFLGVDAVFFTRIQRYLMPAGTEETYIPESVP